MSVISGMLLTGCMAESSEVGYLTTSGERWVGQQSEITSHSVDNRIIFVKEIPPSIRLREQDIDDMAARAVNNIFGDERAEPTTSWYRNDGRPSYLAYDACYGEKSGGNNVLALPSGPRRGEKERGKVWWRLSTNETIPYIREDGSRGRAHTHGDQVQTVNRNLKELIQRMLGLFKNGKFGCPS